MAPYRRRDPLPGQARFGVTAFPPAAVDNTLGLPMATNLWASIDKNALCVFVDAQDEANLRPFGTGFFFMRRDLILTAKHVVDTFFDEPVRIGITNGSTDGKSLGLNPIALLRLSSFDLALVQVSTDGLQMDVPLFPSHHRMSKVTGFIGVGFNKSSSDLQAENRNWHLYAHQISDFKTATWEAKSGMKADMIEFPAPWITPGYSGGPLIANGGGVAGVLLEGFCNVDEVNSSAEKVIGRAVSVAPILETFTSPFERPELRDSVTKIDLRSM
jgi:S1-C subfamily serine protease